VDRCSFLWSSCCWWPHTQPGDVLNSYSQVIDPGTIYPPKISPICTARHSSQV
jgi:hypothetical protein